MVRWYAGTLQHEGACFPEYSFMGFDIHYKYSFCKGRTNSQPYQTNLQLFMVALSLYRVCASFIISPPARNNMNNRYPS